MRAKPAKAVRPLQVVRDTYEKPLSELSLKTWVFLGNGLLIVASVVLFSWSLFRPRPAAPLRVDIEDAAPVSASAPGPERITVGFYLNRIYDIDMVKNQYMADFYIWFRWSPPRKDAPPFEFANARDVRRNEVSFDNQASRDHYRAYRVIGNFRADLHFRNYPFDRQVLAIELEDSVSSLDKITYLPDSHSSFAPMTTISEWVPRRLVLKRDAHLYSSDFGEPGSRRTAHEYSRLSLAVHVERQVLPYLLKTFFPLLIILVVASLIFFISPRHSEIRAVTSVTALLTEIALQVATSSSLPNIDYATTMDLFFLAGYVLILLVNIQMVLTTHLVGRRPELADRINRWSRTYFFPVALFALAGIRLLAR